ncbi:MAG: LysM peptidoglycan-binding domain-containing protein [Gammaproteobacteria bacterium]|nr:LysM peptidoglycan-binding domain-containing protein [Gammaproteobacteria bacterium]
MAQRQPATSHERLVASTLAGMALLAASPPGQAMTLGEITVHSSLGQHLDASVPVQLAAGESLASGCIQSTQGSASDLGRVPNAAVLTPEAARPGRYTLRISSAAALYEPIYAMKLQASCPGTAAISRQYVLMLDLPGMASEQTSIPAQPPVTQTGQLPDALPASLSRGDVLRTAPSADRPPRSRRTLDSMGTPIQPGTRYQVVRGDTLSSIAARVSGRKVKLWTLAGQIFAANPAAFIRNDINLIKLGSTIVIPAADEALANSPGIAALPATQPVPTPVPLPESAPPVAALPVDRQATPVTATATTESPTTAGLAATTPVEMAPAISISPRAETAVSPSPAASAQVESRADNEASPLAATAAGIVFGLLVSALLWFRNRLPAMARKRPAQQPAKPEPVAEALPLPVAAAAAAAPIAVRTQRAEPSITVQWSARPEDTLAAEFAQPAPAPASKAEVPASSARSSAATSDEITSELEKLFGDDSETMSAPVVASLPDDSDRNDNDADDEKKAETLLQALSLLERDYEAELTASQVLDLSAMREALATGTDSKPFIKKPD